MKIEIVLVLYVVFIIILKLNILKDLSAKNPDRNKIHIISILFCRLKINVIIKID